jgi:CheY-like chemotaxis protein
MPFRKDLINRHLARDEILYQNIRNKAQIFAILNNRGPVIQHSHVYPERFMKDYSEDQLLVLVIEEKQEILQQVASALAAADYSTCCCASVEEAMAAAVDNPPDLIISDISLNGTSGPELCERIKRRKGLETAPVMFLSGGQIPDIIRRHDQTGGSYYLLRKPFDPDVLVELVDKALQTPALAGS